MTSGRGLNKSLGEELWVFLHSNRKRGNGGCQKGQQAFQPGKHSVEKRPAIQDLQPVVDLPKTVASHKL